MSLDSQNPFFALASLPADVAVVYETIRYVFIVTLGAYVWDWLVSMSQEYKMLKRDGLSKTLAVYFLSRLMNLAYCTIGVAYFVSPLPDCHTTLRVLAIIAIFTSLTTGYLFFLRIWAIFHGNRWLIGLFGGLWFSVTATSLLVPFSIHADFIPGTHHCMPGEMDTKAGVYGLINIVYHSLIFISISWKLVTMQRASQTSFSDLIRGRGFSNISKVLWSSGQLYFFTTVTIDIANMAFVIAPTSVPLNHFMLVTATDALENAMACRIFRQLKFDTRSEYVDTIVQNSSALPYHNHSGSRNRSGASSDTRAGSLPLVFLRDTDTLQVNVQKQVETTNDHEAQPGADVKAPGQAHVQNW